MNKEQLNNEEALFEQNVRQLFELKDPSPELKDRIRESLLVADADLGGNNVIEMPGVWQKHWWKAAAAVAGVATGMALWNPAGSSGGLQVVEGQTNKAIEAEVVGNNGGGVVIDSGNVKRVKGGNVILSEQYRGIKSPVNQNFSPVYETHRVKMNAFDVRDPETGKVHFQVVPETEVIYEPVQFN